VHLTGNSSQRLGLINKALPKERVLEEALKLATRISAMSGPVVAAAKQAVSTDGKPSSLRAKDANRDGQTAESTHVDAGLVHEKALYFSTLSAHDCHEGLKEGLRAFLEKREPVFEHR